MTNIEMIEFIDEFLREQEDVLHGIEGRDCTKSRKYLDMIKKQLTLTDVSSMFSAKQMEKAYNDGVEAEQQRCGEFDIENYC